MFAGAVDPDDGRRRGVVFRRVTPTVQSVTLTVALPENRGSAAGVEQGGHRYVPGWDHERPPAVLAAGAAEGPSPASRRSVAAHGDVLFAAHAVCVKLPVGDAGDDPVLGTKADFADDELGAGELAIGGEQPLGPAVELASFDVVLRRHRAPPALRLGSCAVAPHTRRRLGVRRPGSLLVLGDPPVALEAPERCRELLLPKLARCDPDFFHLRSLLAVEGGEAWGLASVVLDEVCEHPAHLDRGVLGRVADETERCGGVCGGRGRWWCAGRRQEPTARLERRRSFPTRTRR